MKMLKNLLSYLAKTCRYGRIYMGVTKTDSGSPFAKMSTFWELPVPEEGIHMENKAKGKYHWCLE